MSLPVEPSTSGNKPRIISDRLLKPWEKLRPGEAPTQYPKQWTVPRPQRPKWKPDPRTQQGYELSQSYANTSTQRPHVQETSFSGDTSEVRVSTQPRAPSNRYALRQRTSTATRPSESSTSSGSRLETRINIPETPDISETAPLLPGASAAGGGILGTTLSGTTSGGIVAGGAAAGLLAGFGLPKIFGGGDKGDGYTLPGSEYIGPGNDIKIGPARHPADQIARDHDLGYEEALRHATAAGFTKEQFDTEISKLDKTAWNSFLNRAKNHKDWRALIGYLGLRTKGFIEDKLGIQYPVFPGMYDKPPPNERPNWASLNEGQRRYAWEQYNLALVRRGLPINHPIPGKQQGNADPLGDLDAIIEQPHEGEEELVRQLDQDQLEQDYIQGFDESYLENNYQNARGEHSGEMATPGMSAPKRARPADPNPSTADSTSAQPAKKKLPGTAKDQGGGELEGGPRPYALPHPTTSIHSYVRYYRKVHRFITYGLAYKPITKQVGTAPNIIKYYVMTTPLAEIPWDFVPLYINRSEWEILPLGSSIAKARVQVLQRNVRVAFPTNSTASNLATLNQNKNVITAIGLNKKVDAVPIKYTSFQAEQPMIPTNFDEWKYTDMTAMSMDMYGAQDYTAFATQTPRHQMGIPQTLKNYLGLLYRQYDGNIDGWECLQEHYREHDADSSTGNVILQSEYHPAVGIIRPPQRQIVRKFIDNTIKINRGSHTLDPRETTVAMDPKTGDPQSSKDSLINVQKVSDAKPFGLNNWVQKIEKCQEYYQGVFNHNPPRVQPTIHIGIQPTIALTTANLVTDQTNSSFTDTQGYFEVVAEAEVNTSYPTFRPHTVVPNVKEGDLWLTGTAVRIDKPLFDGLYISV